MPAAKKNYPVTLKLDGKCVIAVPNDLPDVKVGETIQFRSDDGDFKVEFKDSWPFAGKDRSITDGRRRTFKREGPFKFLCFIAAPATAHLAPSGGYAVAESKSKNKGEGKWATYKSKSGAHGNVNPPGHP